ncbi:hypothetical protein ABZZ80_02525 [Streptomyces sp. NPDC006356]
MPFEKHTTVVKAEHTPDDELRLYGEVTGNATDPITGDRLVMVQWPGAPKALPYREHELVIAD